MRLKKTIFILIVMIFASSLFARGEVSTIPSEIFKGCAKCHGHAGKNEAYGRSEELAGQEVEDLVESINNSYGKTGKTPK